MRSKSRLFLFALAMAISCAAESSPTTPRDDALKKIEACLRSNDLSTRQCKKLNQNIEILIDTYKGGDKSVLPTLLRFTFLTDFLDKALLSDPDGFLTAVKQLPEKEQAAVALGIAGGPFRPLTKAQFTVVRALLLKIPDSSANAHIAEACLRAVETNNASLFLDYFPPQTFTGGAAKFQVFWYSRDLYSLGEQPLWPPAAPSLMIYRFTRLGAFDGPKTISLTVLPNGISNVTMKSLTPSREKKETAESKTITAEEVARFFGMLQRADYWHMPTEVTDRGLDGAEWILEGVEDGNYKIVTRWCPSSESRDPHALAFANAARLLFEFAGHKYGDGC